MTTAGPTTPTPTQETDHPAAWHPCGDPDTCTRRHWLAVGYRDGAQTAVALHESTPPAVRAPAQRTP